jgi:hypothetical protein
VALESWQFNCKSTRPSRGGFVRLRDHAARVPAVPEKGPLVRNLSFPASNPVLLLEHVSSEVSYLAGSSLHEKASRPHLFSALLVSR